MMNNNTNKAFLLITTCMFLCLGAIIAQPTCKQYDDWCTHEVRVENSSSDEVSVWCKEIGCDNTDYFMANLKPGEHLFAYPDAYNAVFSIKFGNITLKTFDQLGADWNCNYYTFNYSNDSFVDCSKGIDLRVSPTQSICEGGSVEICADNASHYNWSNGATSQCIIVSPLYTQAYSVTGSKNGCEQTGYVNVNVFSSVNLKVSNEQSICEGGSVEICADNASHYYWSNGATSQCIIVSPLYTQAYSVTGSKNGCEQTGYVNVNVNNSINLKVSSEQSICEGGSVEICADNASHYVWSNGATSQCIIVSPLYTQAYSVTGSKNGCEQTGHVNVNVNNSINLKVSSEQSICEGGSVEICADNASHYYWSNGATSQCIIVSPLYTQAYSVTGSKNGCEQTGHVNVNVFSSVNLKVSSEQSICEGGSVEICADNASHYYWSNGATSQCIIVSPLYTQAYSVTGSKNGCEQTGYVNVNVFSSVNLKVSNEQSICEGGSVEICADNASHYYWSNGATSQCIIVSPLYTQAYSVTGSKNGCEQTGYVNVNVNNSINLKVSSEQSICEGGSVEICADNASHYYWSNGATSQCIIVSPLYTQAYSVTGSKNGCEQTGYVNVNVNNSINLKVSSEQSICEGGSVEICADNASHYVWSNGATSQCIIVSPLYTQAYSVTGSKNGCEQTGYVNVNVNNSINLKVSSEQSICEGGSVEICADNASHYVWSNGATSQCIIVSPLYTQAYSVTGSKNGCEQTGYVNVNVFSSINLKVSSEQSICEGGSVEICADNASHYVWSNGATSQCIIVSPLYTQAYSVTGSKNGCEQTGYVNVNVFSSINLKVSSEQSICEGGSVEICADNASHYVWSNGATSQCIIVSPLYTQAYSVTGSKNGCEQTGYINVNVFSSVNLKVSSEQSICEGGSVEICADNASHYVWSNGATSQCIIVSPHYTQAYSVTGSKNGCEQTGYINVNVIECQSNFSTCIPNDFNLYESYISAHEADLEWVEVPGATYTFYIKEIHESEWGIFDIHENYVTVQSLDYCAHYQWAVLITCSDGKTAEFSPTREFSTCGHQPRISSTKNATVSFNNIENTPILEIAPNPATDFLKINYTGLNVQQLKVYNTGGQLTETLQADESGISTLNTSNYNKGMYVIFAEANDKVFKNKFIVR